MSASGRLTFLYPYLLRASAARTSVPAKTWGGAGARANSSFAKRAGKAVEPLGWEKGKQQRQQRKGQQQQAVAKDAAEEEDGAENKAEIGKQYFQNLEREKEKDVLDAPPVMKEVEASSTTITDEKQVEQQQQQQQQQLQQQPPPFHKDETDGPAESSADSLADGVVGQALQPVKAVAKPGELEAAYLGGMPESAKKREVIPSPSPSPSPSPAAASSPSPSPQRYIHHFDSYSLVKQLQEGGYTNDQAISSMKAIRGLLARNLDVAQETLVSKSDVENETYLFSAACSELSAEIKNNRRAQDEHTRQQRTHLQHEVDILTQSLNQELLTLNDSVRGLFNDRRMAVREEQKSVDSAIQKVNYKMSILLSSDSKSEIEGVRWILIRRSVVGILFMAMLTLGTIRYASYVSHERQKEAAAAAAERRRRKVEEEEEEERGRREGGIKTTEHPTGPDAAEVLAAN